MTEHIGIYRVERPIGRGGMGEVFLAWDDRLERRVAIKRIRRDARLSAEQRERFRREARLAARLSHSAVVQIYDIVIGDADDAIVMEYVEGRTLAERLADGPLEVAEALRLAQEIALGLAAAQRCWDSAAPQGVRCRPRVSRFSAPATQFGAERRRAPQ